MPAMAKLKSLVILLNLLIGLIKLLLPSKIKDNVAHVGLFLPVVLLKDSMPSVTTKSKTLLLNNLLIVQEDNIKMKDVMVEICQMPSGM